MSAPTEIESAARCLPLAERQKLLILIAQSLRDDSQPLPEPRQFPVAEMQERMDEDEQDLKPFRTHG